MLKQNNPGGKKHLFLFRPEFYASNQIAVCDRLNSPHGR